MGNTPPSISYAEYPPDHSSHKSCERVAITVGLEKNFGAALTAKNRFALDPCGRHILKISRLITYRGKQFLVEDPFHPELISYLTYWGNIDLDRNRNVLCKTRATLQWQQAGSPPDPDELFVFIPVTIDSDSIHTSTSAAPGVLLPYVATIVARYHLACSTSGEDTCPITYDRLSEQTEVFVGLCGHVFSEVVREQAACPLCRLSTGWTGVRPAAQA